MRLYWVPPSLFYIVVVVSDGGVHEFQPHFSVIFYVIKFVKVVNVSLLVEADLQTLLLLGTLL